jgi:hypothetical protein
MKTLRSLHLYLGCVFAPMLMFFAVSGIWQTLGIQSGLLNRLSTLHTSHQLKDGSSLTGGVFVIFVLVMALSFLATTILGVMLAIRHGGSRRAAYGCLAFGVAFPLVLVVLKAMKVPV